MKKYFLIFLAFIVSIVSFMQWNTFAASRSPCNPESIANVFSKAIMLENDIFNGSKIEKKLKTKNSSIKDILTTYVKKEKNKYRYQMKKYEKKTFEFTSPMDRYHNIQDNLFKNAIVQTLSGLETKKPKFNKNVWKEDSHPIVYLYKDTYTNMSKGDIPPIIPTLVVGFEATLNFTILSCAYQIDENKLVENSKNPLDIITNIRKDKLEKIKEVGKAERIIVNALSSYESLLLAYPQHVAYQNLIKKMSDLKDTFMDFEAVNSECVYSNHIYATCEKQ